MAVSITPTQMTWDTVTYGHVGGVPGTSTSVSLQSPYYSGTEAYVMFVNENVTATCANWINWGKPLVANPDISGLGVILSFVISAYLVMLWALFAYGFGLIPASLLRTADRRCFFANSRRVHSEWYVALQKATIIFADQQIITGIGILVAGYANLDSGISAYHWQIITYLAWMSSNVHLTTLTLLRDWLDANRVLRRWRIAGMTILLLLLIAALIPTTKYVWISALRNHPLKEFSYYSPEKENDGLGLGIPAKCFWDFRDPSRGELFRDVNIDSPFSFAILILGYVWKLGQLYNGSRTWSKKWLRCVPEWLLERAAIYELRSQHSWPFGSRMRYRIIMLVYVPMVAWFEFLESFAASLWLLLLGLIWGSMQIFLPRNSAPSHVIREESVWGFGQILPLLFLLQPAAATFEHFYASHVDRKFRKQQSELLLEMRHQDSMKSIQSSTTVLAASDADSDALVAKETATKLSDCFRTMKLGRPGQRAAANETPPHQEFLYSSKFFKSILWSYHALILGCACLVFAVSGLSSSSLKGYVWQWAVWGGAGSFGWVCLIYVPIGSFFSKAFR
ncbi:hypothetical protein KC331_g8143 [Hortaea werneckii]|nr:hypothetical protein KC331_g8143 [Hortaea werneckii]KAI7713632.1 hypothetical protein KC353_g7400 [Hortaea werneckii]